MPLCAPPDLSAFLHSWITIILKHIAIPVGYNCMSCMYSYIAMLMLYHMLIGYAHVAIHRGISKIFIMGFPPVRNYRNIFGM